VRRGKGEIVFSTLGAFRSLVSVCVCVCGIGCWGGTCGGQIEAGEKEVVIVCDYNSEPRIFNNSENPS
jgi:hypothetical protein